MNTNLEFQGKIIKVFPPRQAGDYTVNEFVVMDTGKYPQSAKFQLFNKPNETDFVKVGNQVIVKFNLKGNEYKDKFFTNLDAWSVRPLKYENTPTAKTETAPEFDNSETNDLPF